MTRKAASIAAMVTALAGSSAAQDTAGMALSHEYAAPAWAFTIL